MFKNKNVDMVNGPIFRGLLLFAIPLMISSILQLLFNAADVVVVGRFAGDDALAAVGSNGPLINLMTNFFLGLSVGSNVLVARFLGAKKDKAVSETVHTAMFLSIISGIILTILGLAFAETILGWMDAPKDVLPLAALYLRIYFIGMIAMMLYNFGSAILRAIGDTTRPLYYLAFSGVINVILNLIFVIGLKMSVAGVALATVISQVISAALIVRCLMKESSAIKLELRKLRIYGDKLKMILRIGIPASLQGIIFSISNVIIQASINSFGKVVVSGNSAAGSIEGFVYVSMNAFHQATISFTSQNMGAGRYDRINKILIKAEIGVIGVGLLLGNMVVLFARPLLGIYSTSSSVIDAGFTRLLWVSAPYFLCGVMEVLVGSMRGLGYAMVPTIVSLIGACGLRLLWIFTFFQTEQFHKPHWLYATYPFSWTVTILAHLVSFIIIRRHIHKTIESRYM